MILTSVSSLFCYNYTKTVYILLKEYTIQYILIMVVLLYYTITKIFQKRCKMYINVYFNGAS